VTERSTVEILRAARERISDPERWCSSGPGNGRDRVCALIALDLEVGGPGYANPAYELLRKAAGGLISDFNDSHGHRDVLAMYDRAISSAEEASC